MARWRRTLYLAAVAAAVTVIYGCGGEAPPGPDPIFLAPPMHVRFFTYVANNTNTMGSVSGYMIDATSGALTSVTGSPFTAGARILVRSFSTWPIWARLSCIGK